MYRDEIPFEIPEGWEWSRITGLCTKITDGTHHSPDNFPTGDYMYVTAKNIKESGIVLEDITYVTKEVHQEIYSRCNPEKGDILYIKDGATSGVATINDIDTEFSLLSSVALLKPSRITCNYYLCYVMQSPYFYATTRGDMKGVGITRITLTMINSRLIPVAPLEEQKRITECLQKTLPAIFELENNNKEALDLIELTKAKVLDLAIKGKLVPQHPSDEPASALLERIRAEKEELIKQGKLKHDKKESIIYKGDDNSYLEKFCSSTVVDITEEIPFDLPQGWRWCRLKEIVQIINGDRGSNYPAKNKLHDNGIPFVSASNIDDGIVSHESGMKYMSQEQYSLLRAGLLQYNDIVYCIRGSLGKCGIFPYEHGAIASSLVIVRPFVKASSITDYVMIYLNSALAFSEIKKYDNGTAQPNLAAKDFENFLIPLPPLNMINMIVKKYNQLMAEVSLICEAI